MNLFIKMKILERGISQFELSRIIGVSDAYLSKVIRGWINPTPEISQRIAEALGCQIEEIFPKG